MDFWTRFTFSFLPSVSAHHFSGHSFMLGEKIWVNAGIFIGIPMSCFQCLLVAWSPGAFRVLGTVFCALAYGLIWLSALPTAPLKAPFLLGISCLALALPWWWERYRLPASVVTEPDGTGFTAGKRPKRWWALVPAAREFFSRLAGKLAPEGPCSRCAGISSQLAGTLAPEGHCSR